MNNLPDSNHGSKTGKAPDTRPVETQKFARYEFKYLLRKREADAIEREISHFMTYDGHVDKDMENRYIVRSLYFDDPFSSSFYEKTDGIKTRKKFRLRTYGREHIQGLPIYLEEKGRHNERTYKRRVEISFDHLNFFSDPSKHFQVLDLYRNSVLVENFLFDSTRRSLAPRVLVEYLRRPYTSVFDTNFRLTFDSHLFAAPAVDLLPTTTNMAWLACRAGWTILELKFDRRIPAWFHRTLQAYDLRRISISKFCEGLETCGIATDLS